METNKVTIKQGYAGDILFYIKNSDGDAKNLTGAVAHFMIKNKKSDADTDALISKLSTGSDVALTTPTDGLLTVTLSRAETLALTKNCTAEIVLRYSATEIVHTKDIEVTLIKSIKTGTIS